MNFIRNSSLGIHHLFKNLFMVLPKRKIKNGFTLIELLVAMAIFSIVITAVIGIFSSGMTEIERAFGHQDIQDSARFVLESMSKEIRMSTINTANGGPYSSVNITNADGQTLDYTFSGNQLLRNGEALNSANVRMTGAFYVQKTGALLPRVTVAIRAVNVNPPAARQARINLQTTISSREYAQ
jgi:type IV pilus assembly protein PilW